jgi:EAL domain-containing protein (putative c-di-GMP-specific phosphodiesterase class I)
VETEAQRAFLGDHCCPLAQGFLIARPMPPEDVRQPLEVAQPIA